MDTAGGDLRAREKGSIVGEDNSWRSTLIRTRVLPRRLSMCVPERVVNCNPTLLIGGDYK
jgi:hypothetical protein